MNRIFKIFTLLMIIGSVNEVFAAERIVVSRHRTGCFPGCNTVHERKKPGRIQGADGDWYDVDFVKISCSGIGLKSCPKSIAPTNFTPVLTISPFDLANGNAQMAYALDAIASGTINGTHNITVTNTSDGTNWIYKVIWSTDANGLEIITVTTVQI